MNKPAIKPLNIWQSLALVIVPAGTAAWLLHVVIPPIVERNNIPFLYLYLPWWIGFMLIYFVASFVAYRLEGNPFTLTRFADRYRLHKIQGREWIWLLALFITFVIAISGVGIFGKELSSLPLLSMPDAFPPELDPSDRIGRVPGEFMGASLKGQWWIAIIYFLGWVLNIFGEEFWFRGYILPRQEVAYGKWAWSVHGLMWAINHLFQVWTLVILFPYAFLWAYLIQRGRNTWIPIIVHGLGNFVPLVVILMGVIG